MNEVMPTFSKITTILDYVNHGKSSIDHLKKPKRIPECVNILGNCESKLN